MTNPEFTRRRFLKASLIAASAPFILPSHLRAADRPPNDRIALGIIGTGRMGGTLINRFLGEPDVRIVAVCDVDTIRREHHQQRINEHYAETANPSHHEGCEAYNDFREVLGRDDIDGVVIATPDHWHAIMSIEAARANKDIYCEKPLSQSVNEAGAMVAAVRNHKRIFQTGSQQRSSANFRRACTLVRNEAIGKLQRVNVALPAGLATWCDLPEEDAPDGLDWDLWLGPAPERGWNEELSPRGVHSHFPDWRNYREYGGGMITDWGAHHFDIAQWAMGTDDSGPVEVIPPPKENAASGARLIYRNGVELTHLEGNGITFFGTKGQLFVNRHNLEVTPEGLEERPLPDDADRLYQSDNHTRNWLDCMRSRKKPICDVEIGARSVTICHLVNMAYWHRERMTWNPHENEFMGNTGDPDWLDVPYRTPWKLPEV